jgi:hypothetical protein
MKYLIVIISSIIFISCKQSIPQLSEKITNADSMAINFFKGDGSMDTVVTVKIISDKNKINQLAKIAGGTVTDNSNCGYDGSVHFFKNNQVIQDISFRMNDPECNHFSFKLDGKIYSTQLTPETKEIILSLKK